VRVADAAEITAAAVSTTVIVTVSESAGSLGPSSPTVRNCREGSVKKGSNRAQTTTPQEDGDQGDAGTGPNLRPDDPVSPRRSDGERHTMTELIASSPGNKKQDRGRGRGKGHPKWIPRGPAGLLIEEPLPCDGKSEDREDDEDS
jgi:hypothetical protein